jgi:hypothetical protein
MANTRELAISQQMRNSITIHNFIYHIIITSEADVDYLSAVTLTEEQKSFFKDMIAESSRGTKYTFSDRENAPVFEYANELVADIANSALFIEKSRAIAHNFKATHDNRMADGIVIVTTFSMSVGAGVKNFLSVLKIDYKPVLQQIRDETDPSQVTFQKITDSLLEDKAAIQKRALIDVSDTFEWDVIAVERGKPLSKQDTEVAIGEHFRNFLSVTLLENNSTLTRKVIAQTKQWAFSHEQLSPPDVKARVIKYIEAHDGQNVTLDDIRDLVCDHENEEVQTALTESFDAYMDQVSLSGVQFVSRAQSIPAADRKTKLTTNKNVTLEWQGEMSDAGIEITTENGETKITILAEQVNEIS